MDVAASCGKHRARPASVGAAAGGDAGEVLTGDACLAAVAKAREERGEGLAGERWGAESLCEQADREQGLWVFGAQPAPELGRAVERGGVAARCVAVDEVAQHSLDELVERCRGQKLLAPCELLARELAHDPLTGGP